MKKARILSLLLALGIMLAALPLPVSAAGADPTLKIKNSGTNAQTLSLSSLPADCHGIQITLELDREPDDHTAFVFAESLPTAGAYYTYQDGAPGEWNLTLYLTAKAAFAPGELVLGTLSNHEEFQIEAVSNLELLVGSSDNLESISHETVTLEKTVQSDSGTPGTPGIPGTPGNPSTPGTPGTPGNPSTPGTPGNPSSPDVPGPAALPFTDVKPSDWYYDAVGYVYAHGLMTGTSETAFSPQVVSSRGMIVTILYRLEGEPSAGSASFHDVEPGQWYSDAVNWCAEHGIVTGYDDGRFGPKDTISREQMAAILYRYAQYKGYDVSARANLSGFTDAGKVSAYALEAMQWAVAEQLIQGVASGTGTMLSPSGSAVRSQSATILMRFCENIAGR